jgi:hypothetical protein
MDIQFQEVGGIIRRLARARAARRMANPQRGQIDPLRLGLDRADRAAREDVVFTRAGSKLP